MSCLGGSNGPKTSTLLNLVCTLKEEAVVSLGNTVVGLTDKLRAAIWQHRDATRHTAVPSILQEKYRYCLCRSALLILESQRIQKCISWKSFMFKKWWKFNEELEKIVICDECCEITSFISKVCLLTYLWIMTNIDNTILIISLYKIWESLIENACCPDSMYSIRKSTDHTCRKSNLMLNVYFET